MVKRRVPCLDDYLDRVNLLLWPRFKVMTDSANRQNMSPYGPGTAVPLVAHGCNKQWATMRRVCPCCSSDWGYVLHCILPTGDVTCRHCQWLMLSMLCLLYFLQVLFDVQAASVRPGVERSLFGSAVEVTGLTRRYAAFAASCLTLMADHDTDDSEWLTCHSYKWLAKVSALQHQNPKCSAAVHAVLPGRSQNNRIASSSHAKCLILMRPAAYGHCACLWHLAYVNRVDLYHVQVSSRCPHSMRCWSAFGQQFLTCCYE